MANLNLAQNQPVAMPSIMLTDGKPLTGHARMLDNDHLLVEITDAKRGAIPAEIEADGVLQWDVEGCGRACPVSIIKHAERNLVAQVAIAERRESARYRVEMDIVYEEVPPADAKSVAEEVMARVNGFEEDPKFSRSSRRDSANELDLLRDDIASLRALMMEMVTRIEDLTAIVSGVAPPSAANAHVRPLAVLNCSSSGLGMITPKRHKAGDYLRMQLTLKTTPRTVIDCMAMIVRSQSITGASAQNVTRHEAGVYFTHIHESDREQLVHYLFKAQRRQLRDLKEARAAFEEQV